MIASRARGLSFPEFFSSHASVIFWSTLCAFFSGFVSETSIFFSHTMTVPSSNRTASSTSSSVTGITLPRTSNMSESVVTAVSKLPVISTRAVSNIFPILLLPITHSSREKLYSKSLRTISVFFASAAIARRISHGGRIPYLSRISHVFPPLSATEMIAEILKSVRCFMP